MAPVTPHWRQPSHADIQEVLVNQTDFTSRSLSKIALAPFAVYAKLRLPPCHATREPTYATVQIGRDRHMSLNSDLLYINHSCEPSLIFDTGSMSILAGPKGLRHGDELTYFYPSTEWHMAQPFSCHCGTPACRGTISGARDMTAEQLEGHWLSGHIRDLLAEQQQKTATDAHGCDPTVDALREALAEAEKVVESVSLALRTYLDASTQASGDADGRVGGGFEVDDVSTKANALNTRGPTWRERSGEMGGDTAIA
ncbi:hypothetical protein DCS_07329 [Drechmeria coniospora]|uniref:Post-SET domain-containing protein n=1 Tax=Drechmeria coniospora TaxID=98403 RepID=A0A151GE53_DRECN|nr:hypothetical protein DCS_07329 [Drechmeria coniospora]KYK55366.1 hypothetical protein DCS_07329 [Drechmeria coniospora]